MKENTKRLSDLSDLGSLIFMRPKEENPSCFVGPHEQFPHEKPNFCVWPYQLTG